MKWWIATVGLLAGTAGLGGAEPQQFASGVNRTHLLELYTSEGCSSCPPAEKRLADLRAHPRLWRDFVPVAFHVNYWDRLGWTDRFASREFTAREYAYAEVWGSRTVYTPCFVLNGADQRNRVGDALLAASREQPGVLTAEYDGRGVLKVAFAAAGSGDHEVHAAILGGGIVSRVKAGENRGETLRHEFVALELKSTTLREGSATLRLPKAEVEGVTRHALAVWVTRRGQLAPVQAAGGWID